MEKKHKNKPFIYFDSACMSLKPKQVIEKMLEYYKEYTACHGRSVHDFSEKTTEEFENVRRKVAKMIGAREDEIIFTKNTTESINFVANFFRGKKVITTDLEHNSNFIPWKKMSGKHTIIHVDEKTGFDFETFEKEVKDADLVSVVHYSNFSGHILPVKEIIKIAHKNGVKVLLDCAQSAPHVEINVRDLGADFIAFSGHKMLGPTGVGVLYGKINLLKDFEGMMFGGETVKNVDKNKIEWEDIPHKFEAGLQNYGGIIGFGAAIDYLLKLGWKNIENYESKLVKELVEGCEKLGLRYVGPKERPALISIVPKTLSAHELALLLNEENIFVRSGMHCVHYYHNEVLKVAGTVRASLYFYNTFEEIHNFYKVLEKIQKTFI
ncbi:MAG: cysteine desulfurase [Nitrososphaeria archaeon]